MTSIAHRLSRADLARLEALTAKLGSVGLMNGEYLERLRLQRRQALADEAEELRTEGHQSPDAEKPKHTNFHE